MGFTVTKWETTPGRSLIVRVKMNTDIGFRLIQSNDDKTIFKLLLDCTTTARDVADNAVMLTYSSTSEYLLVYDGASDENAALGRTIMSTYSRHISYLKKQETAVPLWNVTEVVDPSAIRESILKVLRTAL